MTLFEAKRVIRKVSEILRIIGEPMGALEFHIIENAGSRDPYALFQGDIDALGNRTEQMFVYANDIGFGKNGLSYEEIALHETRHIVQFRRGQELFASHDALFLRALSVSGRNKRVMDLFTRCRRANEKDALESDAMFITALVYDLEYPIVAAFAL